MEFHLAQINIGRILGPIDGPVMAEFVANLDSINALAETSEGFVWRLKEDNNNATYVRAFEDEFLLLNMSVWTHTESLFQYVYQSKHMEFLKQRKKWFEKLSDMHMALWYIPAGYIPTPADGIERLNYLRSNGDTPYAFSFKNRITVEEFKNSGFVKQLF